MGGKILDYPAKDILTKGRADEVEETVDTVLEIMKELKHTP